MSSLDVEIQDARARRVEINDETLTVELLDGRVISVPLAWFPRLWYGTPKERERFQLIGDGAIIHWPDLDEDLSIEGILAGRRSGESPESLNRWLAAREQGKEASSAVIAPRRTACGSSDDLPAPGRADKTREA